jgi:hypothetical protein
MPFQARVKGCQTVSKSVKESNRSVLFTGTELAAEHFHGLVERLAAKYTRIRFGRSDTLESMLPADAGCGEIAS